MVATPRLIEIRQHMLEQALDWYILYRNIYYATGMGGRLADRIMAAEIARPAVSFQLAPASVDAVHRNQRRYCAISAADKRNRLFLITSPQYFDACSTWPHASSRTLLD